MGTTGAYACACSGDNIEVRWNPNDRDRGNGRLHLKHHQPSVWVDESVNYYSVNIGSGVTHIPAPGASIFPYYFEMEKEDNCM